MALRRVLLALVLPFCCPWRAPVTSAAISGGGGGRGLYRRTGQGRQRNIPAAHMSSLSPKWRTPTRRPPRRRLANVGNCTDQRSKSVV